MKPIQQLNALMDEWIITTDKLIKKVEQTRFYMIYVEGQDSPKRRHLTYHDAKKEAERLARLMHKKNIHSRHD